MDSNLINNIKYINAKVYLDKELQINPIIIPYQQNFKIVYNKINITFYEKYIVLNGCRTINEVNTIIKYIKTKYLKNTNIINIDITYIHIINKYILSKL
jgi:hypothetical protein